jgi:hypothetical protein
MVVSVADPIMAQRPRYTSSIFCACLVQLIFRRTWSLSIVRLEKISVSSHLRLRVGAFMAESRAQDGVGGAGAGI